MFEVGSEDGAEKFGLCLCLVRRLKKVEGRDDARGAARNKDDGPAPGVSSNSMAFSGSSAEGVGKGEASFAAASALAALAAAIFCASLDKGLLALASVAGVDEGDCSISC